MEMGNVQYSLNGHLNIMMHPGVKPIVYTKSRGQGLERKALGLLIFTIKEPKMVIINTQAKLLKSMV